MNAVYRGLILLQQTTGQRTTYHSVAEDLWDSSDKAYQPALLPVCKTFVNGTPQVLPKPVYNPAARPSRLDSHPISPQEATIMALITRISRLFQADFHAVLDRIEEPDVLLRQAVREMEEELVRDEQRGKRLQQDQRQLVTHERELAQSLQEIEKELDSCFEAGNDALARACIRRRLETQRFGKHLARRHKALGEALDDLNSRIRENRTRLESMRQKAELLAGETALPADDWNLPEISVRDEDVEVAFLREKQHRSRP
jgi:hypothetical protein